MINNITSSSFIQSFVILNYIVFVLFTMHPNVLQIWHVAVSLQGFC